MALSWTHWTINAGAWWRDADICVMVSQCTVKRAGLGPEGDHLRHSMVNLRAVYDKVQVGERYRGALWAQSSWQPRKHVLVVLDFE